jgi:hypothetical protein
MLDANWIDILVKEQHYVSCQRLDHETIGTEPVW